jgi:hypothetical protein
VTNSTYRLKFLGQFRVILDRRVKEEVAIAQADHGHSCSEGHRQCDMSNDEILERPINKSDLRRDGLVDVDWLVQRCDHR